MAAKYRVSLTETEIAQAATACKDAGLYELYVLFNKQLGRIIGGGKTPDFVIGNTRLRASAEVSATATATATTELRNKLALMGPTRLTNMELSDTLLEMCLDTRSFNATELEFLGMIQYYVSVIAMESANTLFTSVDLNRELLAEGFNTTYAAQFAKFNIPVIAEGSTNAIVPGRPNVEVLRLEDLAPVSAQSAPSFMDYNPVDSVATDSVDSLNKFNI